MQNNNKEQIKITSRRDGDLSTRLMHDGNEYHVITDKGKDSTIKTSVYLRGKTLRTITTQTVAEGKDLLIEMRNQHRTIIDRIKKNCLFSQDTKAISTELERLIAEDRIEQAIDVVKYVLEDRPRESVYNAYYGFLIAKNGNIEEGITICKDALRRAFQSSKRVGWHISTIYLNLGRIYLLQNDRRYAVRAFKSGLGYDPTNERIVRELSLLGIRSKPIIPFLPRSNPINKYLGILRHRLFEKRETL